MEHREWSDHANVYLNLHQQKDEAPFDRKNVIVLYVKW